MSSSVGLSFGREMRRRLGLPRLGVRRAAVEADRHPIVVAASPTLVPPASDWPANVHQTGFLAAPVPDFQPDDHLAHWLGSGAAYVGVIVPAAILGLQRVIVRRTKPRIAQLDALAEYARGIAGVLAVGRGIEQAILQASRSAPQVIGTEVGKLTARIRASWELKRALRAFADDFDDATADVFVATLLLASDRRGPGLAAVMQDMAASVDHEVRARREVETEQQKPRTAARMITIISGLLLAGLLVSGDYIAPYGSLLGQLLLTAYLAGYVAILWWMSRMTKEKPIPRFIGTGGGGNP